MEFPNMKEWWSEDPQEVMSFVFWLQRQVPPTDAKKRQKALEEIADKLNKKHKAPNKKAIAKFIGESNNEILESFADFSKGNPITEAVGKDVHRLVNDFVKKIADKYDYSLQDAVYAMMEVLKSQNYDGLTEAVVNEARSEASKIAKKSGVSKGDVDKVQGVIDQIETADLGRWMVDVLDLDKESITKILKTMMKVYGGNLQITIKH